jgi:hypothetical protein
LNTRFKKSESPIVWGSCLISNKIHGTSGKPAKENYCFIEPCSILFRVLQSIKFSKADKLGVKLKFSLLHWFSTASKEENNTSIPLNYGHKVVFVENWRLINLPFVIPKKRYIWLTRFD